jgi:hypothetical protein
VSNPAGEPLTIDGVTRTIPDWAREKGISRQLLRYRVRTGVPVAELFAPTRLNVKHTDAAVAELRRRVAEGERLVDVAPALGISVTVARGIVRGHARKGVAPWGSEASP